MNIKKTRKLKVQFLIMILIVSLLSSQNYYTWGTSDYKSLPNPILKLTKTNETNGNTVFNFEVLNYSAYPDGMFAPLQDGSNTSDSQTLVEIYNGANNAILKRITYFQKAEDLNNFSISQKTNLINFKSIYIKLTDRQTKKTYQSNTIVLTPDALFNSGISSPTGKYLIDLVSGDFDGDYNTDLVIDGYGSCSIILLSGNGDGTFKTAKTLHYDPHYNVTGLATGYINNDTKLDLAFSLNKKIYILIGKGDGTFAPPKITNDIAYNIEKIKIFDFDKDGFNDIASLNYSDNSVSILKGIGDGTFNALNNLSVGTNPLDMEIGDFDGDSIPDIITANSMSDNISFLKGKGYGLFETAVTLSNFEYANVLATGDFNKDGILDLAGCVRDNVYIILGSKTSFGKEVSTYKVYGRLSGLAVSDYDSDGNLDIAVVKTFDEMCTLKGHGDGSFDISKYRYQLIGGEYGNAIAEDFNKDSKPDVALLNVVYSYVSVFINSYTLPTPTVAPTSTSTATNKPTNTATPTPTATSTSAPTSTATLTATNTTKPINTVTPTSSNTTKPISTVTATASTNTQTVSGSTSGGSVPVAAASSNTATATATATATPTSATPTATPISTKAPTASPTMSTTVDKPTNNIPAAGNLKDIQKHWAKNQISELINNKIISGYQDGTFKPDNNITRAELTLLIAKVLKLKSVQGNTTFKDDNNIPSWAKGYIKAAVDNGIISGYSDGTFKPSKPCTRQETVSMIMKAFKFDKSAANLDFKDASDIQNWAREYVAKAIDLGIIKGYKDKTFKPDKSVSRAEAAAIIVNSEKSRK